MKADFQILTTPKCDTPGTTAMLSFAEKKYMFGHVGEGTQRAVVDTGMRATKLTDLFLTGKVSGREVGGLIGMILTMADVTSCKKEQQNMAKEKKAEAKRKSAGSDISVKFNAAAATAATTATPAPASNLADPMFSIYGGRNLMSFVSTTRTFVFRNDTALAIKELESVSFNDGPIFQDHNITVYALEYNPTVPELSSKSPRKRSFDEIDDGSEMMQGIEATGRKEILKKILEDMFSTKQGILEVKEDDSDYEDALVARLEKEAELARRRAGSTDGPTVQALLLPLQTGKNSQTTSSEGSKLVRPVFPANKPLRRPWPATKVERLPATTPSSTSLSYMVQIKPVRGKFLPNKAKELGVKPGPDYRTIIEGGSVTTAEGNVVTKADCVEPDVTYPGIAMIDIPSSSYIDGTLREVSRWMENEERKIGIWVWILGDDVPVDGAIQLFMKGVEGRHTVSSPTVCPDGIAFEGAAAQLTRLGFLNQDNFPLPRHSNVMGRTGVQVPAIEDSNALFRPAVPLLNFQISPKQDFEVPSGRTAFDFEAIKEEVKTLGDGKYIQLAADAAAEVERVEKETPDDEARLPGENVEIWALGTGSALPSKYRNVSSLLVKVPEVGSLLLDCGENTLGQLWRCTTDIDGLLRDLRCVYISHMHADHHLGSAAVIRRWMQATSGDPEARLSILAPTKFKLWLEEYTNVEDIGLTRIDLIPLESFPMTKKGIVFEPPVDKQLGNLYASLRLEKVDAAYAEHCHGSFTVAFTFRNPEGFKVAYSGDTRPTKQFVEIGKDATVLIHEATFDDELLPEAKHKKHSTTGEAIKAGLDMNAKSLLLTHFSQRYPKLPVIDTDGSFDASNGEKATVVDPIMEADYKGSNKEPSLPGSETKVVVSEVMNKNSDKNKTAHNTEAPPHVSLNQKQSSMKIGFAFDLLRVTVGQMGRLQKFIPALRELFHDEAEKEPEDQEQDDDDDKQKEQVPKDGKKKQAPAAKQGEAGKKSNRQLKKEANKMRSKEKEKERLAEQAQTSS